MVKNLTFKERIITLAFVFLVGVLGGGLTFYALSSVSPKTPSANTEKVTERQVYIENSSAIASVKTVAQSLVTLVSKEDLTSINHKDGKFQQACFNAAENCQKIGVVLTSDGLILSTAEIGDQDLVNWVAVDMLDNHYQLLKVGDFGPARVFQLVKNGELTLTAAERSNYFNLKPILLADSTVTEIGQKAFAVQSAWQNTLRITEGTVAGKLTQHGIMKRIDMNYLPVALNFSEEAKGGVIFDLSGELLNVHNTSGSLSSEQIMAFLKRYALNSKNFAAVNLGVQCLDLDRILATSLGYKVDYGCVVAGGLTDRGGIVDGGVEKDSAAEKAGLKSKDVILEVDNNSLIKADLGQLILNKSAGSRVDLLVLRDGKTIDLFATL